MTPARHPGRARDLLLRDIVEWAARFAGHLRGVTQDGFLADPLMQDAVTRCVDVVGEASGRLLAELLDPTLAPREPVLKAAYLTRNRLAHGYADIIPRVLWDTATISVPALAAAVQAVMPRTPP